MRMEPPPSPPVASDTRPPETAAADPPEDPPTVRPWRQGLCVTPLIFVTLTLRPPNSLAVVLPTGTTPPRSTRRSYWCDEYVATRPRKTSEHSVHGQPATGSSSLMAVGTPPNGSDTSARSAAARAPSGSRKQNAFRSDAPMAASVASSSSTGERSPDRKASTREQASPVQGAADMDEILSRQRG